MSAPRFSINEKEAIVALYVNGKPLKEIAEQFGCDQSYPRVLAWRRGIARRIRWPHVRQKKAF